MRAPHRRQGLENTLLGGPGLPENTPCVALLLGQPKEEMLRGDVLVSQGTGLGVRLVQSLVQVSGHISVRPTGDPGTGFQNLRHTLVDERYRRP